MKSYTNYECNAAQYTSSIRAKFRNYSLTSLKESSIARFDKFNFFQELTDHSLQDHKAKPKDRANSNLLEKLIKENSRFKIFAHDFCPELELDS